MNKRSRSNEFVTDEMDCPSKEDFADKDETDIYLFLKDSGFDDNVAKEFESEPVLRLLSVTLQGPPWVRGGGARWLAWQWLGSLKSSIEPWLSHYIIHTEQEVDGISFLELTMDELNRLFPEKLGTVKKLYRLIQSVSSLEFHK